MVEFSPTQNMHNNTKQLKERDQEANEQFCVWLKINVGLLRNSIDIIAIIKTAY